MGNAMSTIALLARAHAERPAHWVGDDVFLAHVRGLVAESELASVHAGDLFVACACRYGVAEALDVLIASQTTRPEKLPGHLAARGQIAFRAGDFDTADRVWSRLLELTPSDPDALANLAQVRLARKDAPGAMDLLTRAIAAREALGQPVSAIWYRQRLSIARQGNLVEPGVAAARALSAEFRNERMMRAEEKAARLPAIMTIPLILFILPVLFIVILGPAACSISDTLIHKKS